MTNEKVKHYCCEEGCNTIKYGKRNNIQRYKCKVCGKVFSENHKNFKYERNTRRILSLLLNMLENNFFNEKDLEKALQPNNKYYKLIKKIQFNTNFIKFADEESFQITCYKPKLLICQDDKNITFIQIPEYNNPNKNNETEYKREIRIIDDSTQQNLVSNNPNIIRLLTNNDTEKNI